VSPPHLLRAQELLGFRQYHRLSRQFLLHL